MGKRSKVMTRGKLIILSSDFNIRITSFDKKLTKVSPTTIRHILKWSPLILTSYYKYYRRKLLFDIQDVFLKKNRIVCDA